MDISKKKEIADVKQKFLNIGYGTIIVDKPKIITSVFSKVYIGKYCAIGANLKIITLNHDYNYPAIQGTFYKKNFNICHPGEINTPPTIERTKGNVIIGNDVWIGDDVIILSGLKIGDGCCIGAGSIVTKSLEPYTICAGIPCKKIKYRYKPDMINFLIILKWWNWDNEKIKKNLNFFNTNLNKVDVTCIKNIIK